MGFDADELHAARRHLAEIHGVHVLASVPRVTAGELLDFRRAAARLTARPDFTIYDTATPAQSGKLSERAEYFPILTLAAVSEHAGLVGFDLAHNRFCGPRCRRP
jgi:hypothetical protein